MVFMVNKKISYIHYAIFIQLAIGAALLGLLFLRKAGWMTTSSTPNKISYQNNKATSQKNAIIFQSNSISQNTQNNENTEGITYKTTVLTPSASALPVNGMLSLGSLKIPVTIAATPQSQEQGLSNTASLPSNQGMLFIFDTPDTYGFWMKDMRYPLDFVWIDTTMKIIGVTSNVAPGTYPKVFYCTQPACPNPARQNHSGGDEVGRVRSMLEVNAGFSTQHDLKVGQQLQLGQ
jgi:uncharacterized membrane protein (UPF0127 family)